MLAGVTSAEYVEFPGGAGDVVRGGEGAGREGPCFVRIHSGPKCMVVVVILLVAGDADGGRGGVVYAV